MEPLEIDRRPSPTPFCIDRSKNTKSEQELYRLRAFFRDYCLSARLRRYAICLAAILVVSLLVYFFTGVVIVGPVWASGGLVFAGFLGVMSVAAKTDEANKTPFLKKRGVDFCK
ncbi:hypothetical protein KJ713_01680 [Patescibacteria group bacterium]|nr:hypothetical protein [Patescibacteria group bacterium]